MPSLIQRDTHNERILLSQPVARFEQSHRDLYTKWTPHVGNFFSFVLQHTHVLPPCSATPSIAYSLRAMPLNPEKNPRVIFTRNKSKEKRSKFCHGPKYPHV